MTPPTQSPTPMSTTQTITMPTTTDTFAAKPSENAWGKANITSLEAAGISDYAPPWTTITI